MFASWLEQKHEPTKVPYTFMLSHLSKVGRSFLSSSFFDFDLDFLGLDVELFVRFTAAAAEVDARAILGEPTSWLVTHRTKRSTSTCMGWPGPTLAFYLHIFRSALHGTANVWSAKIWKYMFESLINLLVLKTFNFPS